MDITYCKLGCREVIEFCQSAEVKQAKHLLLFGVTYFGTPHDTALKHGQQFQVFLTESW